MVFFTIFLFFSLLGFLKASNTYDSTQLTTGVWLSGAAYCGKENYNTMKLGGPATGFVYKDTLYDIKTETIFVSEIVKSELWKRFGKSFIEKIFFEVVSEWFKISHKYSVKEVI